MENVCKNCCNKFAAKGNYDRFCSDECQDTYEERHYQMEESRQSMREDRQESEDREE